MTSIQRRLTLTLLTATLTLMLAAGAALYLYVRGALIEQFDHALAAEGHAMSGMVVITRSGKLDFEFPRPAATGPIAARQKQYFQVNAENGTVLTRSAGLGEQSLARDAGHRTRTGAWDIMLPGGRPGRAIAIRFNPQPDEDVGPGVITSAAPLLSLIIARDRHVVDETLAVLLSSLLVVAVALSGGVAAAVTVGTRRGLSPLRRISQETERISATSLDHRFALDGLPAELQPIGSRLNDLLQRLDEAFRRERRFTADVAHELRTPIAELRSLAEVALKWPDDAHAAARNYRDALDIATQMQAIVTTLLAIARCEAGRQPHERVPLDLRAIAGEAWESFEAAAVRRGLQVEWHAAPAAPLKSDRVLLLQLIGNLFSNACAHTPEGGRIEVSIGVEENGMMLRVSNTNAALQPADLPRLFEPFWRKDASRTGGIHSGLGLSLVAEYATVLGAEVAVDLPDKDRFRVSVRFPGTPVERDDPSAAPKAAAGSAPPARDNSSAAVQY